MPPSSSSSSLFPTTPFHALLQSVKCVGADALAESLDALDVSRTVAHIVPFSTKKAGAARKEEKVLTHLSWFDVLEADSTLTEEMVLKIVTEKRLSDATFFQQKNHLTHSSPHECIVEPNPWARAIIMALHRGWLTAAQTWFSWKKEPSLSQSTPPHYLTPTRKEDDPGTKTIALLEAILRCPCTSEQRYKLWSLCDTHIIYTLPSSRAHERRALHERLFAHLCKSAPVSGFRVASWLKACDQIREEEEQIKGVPTEASQHHFMIRKELMNYEGGDAAFIRKEWKGMALLPDPLFFLWYAARLRYCLKQLFEETAESTRQAAASVLPEEFAYPPRPFKRNSATKKETLFLLRRLHVEWQHCVETWPRLPPFLQEALQPLLLYVHAGLRRDGIHTETLPDLKGALCSKPQSLVYWAGTLSLENASDAHWWKTRVKDLPLEKQREMALYGLSMTTPHTLSDPRCSVGLTQLFRFMTQTWQEQETPPFSCGEWQAQLRQKMPEMPAALQTDLLTWEASHLEKEMNLSSHHEGHSLKERGARARL